MQTTVDGLLNKRIMVEQPKEGFRIAVDTILLAAAVPVQAGQSVLDMGCGVGGAMLALACRVPDVRIVGVECQAALADLCRANIERNRLPAALDCQRGDVCFFSDREKVDHVMMNPPYLDEARHDVSPNEIKRVADAEGDSTLEDWVAAAARSLKKDGVLTMIHRADRVEEILLHLEKFFQGWVIKAILPKEGKPAKRVVLRAFLNRSERKNVAPLILHRADGGYTQEAEDIFRHAAAIDFTE